VKRGASDIHLEPVETEMRVRFRVTACCKTVMSPPLRFENAMTSRIRSWPKRTSRKASAARRPHHDQYRADGRKKELDFPRFPRADAVRRKDRDALARQENLRLDMTKLGFRAESLKKFERNI